MKTHFTTYDVVCMTTELQRLIDMRVNQIYDIDNKTYLIRLTRGEEKVVLLLESGSRFHTTAFEWPKNVAPSSFTIKLRKHLKNKRLEKLEQLGVDRVIDMQFGTGEAAYHVILELYDRGNVVLTDCDMTILNVLRPHSEGEEIRLAVREKYPLHRVKQASGPYTLESVQNIIEKCKPGDRLGNILTNYIDCGPTMIKHLLMKYDLDSCKIPGEIQKEPEQDGKKSKKKKNKKDNNEANRDFDKDTDMQLLFNAINDAQLLMKKAKEVKSKGYLIQKRELKPVTKPDEEEYFYSNIEFHPFIYSQNEGRPFKEIESFDLSVDEFFSNQEGQKIDLKAMHQEREALKKLSNVRMDHAKRLEDLTNVQKVDHKRAELITRNQQLVDNAILAIRSALANQMSWPDIHELVKAAQANEDPVASCIKQLKLESNHITIYLTDPYAQNDNEDDVNDDDKLEPMIVNVDLGLSAYANARHCHDQRRNAAKKEQKTIESSTKAMKSAEKKTQQALKEVKTMTSIQKARKTYWFEKFYWFISSENYLIISGRDQQQNELIVKRYMRATDIYVHADIQGASSVVIRNPTGFDIPPKTLLEAGAMAISYSIAWDAKVVTSAYWVKSDQVSKTAPTGEYLGTGSFMIRGKKNFLPPCHLVLGLSFLFKLEDSSIERHKGERRIRNFDDEEIGIKSEQQFIENEKLDTVQEEGDQEIDLGNSDSDNENKDIKDEINEEEEKDDEKIMQDFPKKENDDEDDDQVGGFPDTHVKVDHDTGRITMKSDPKIERLNSEIEENENTIFLGDDKPYIIKALPPRKKQQTKQKQKQEQILKKEEELDLQREKNEKDDNLSQAKRGQKGKLKKIKEKYKDQDDEERRLRMEILKSSGGGKSVKKTKKSLEIEDKIKKLAIKQAFANKPPKQEGEEVEEVPAAADVDMLESLTGIPHEEDELLFAIPVVAPYQTLQNYKFKVKLTPGTGKRGRAAKMAVQIFLKDRFCSPREKDLIKNVKEDMLARNIPGKVKLSAPQMQKVYR